MRANTNACVFICTEIVETAWVDEIMMFSDASPGIIMVHSKAELSVDVHLNPTTSPLQA